MFSSPVCPAVSHSGSGIWTPLPCTVLCLFPPPMAFSILSSHYTIDVMQLWENKHNNAFVQHCLQQKTPTGTSIFFHKQSWAESVFVLFFEATEYVRKSKMYFELKRTDLIFYWVRLALASHQAVSCIKHISYWLHNWWDKIPYIPTKLVMWIRLG